MLNRIGRRTNANAFNQQSEVARASVAGFNGQFEGPWPLAATLWQGVHGANRL